MVHKYFQRSGEKQLNKKQSNFEIKKIRRRTYTHLLFPVIRDILIIFRLRGRKRFILELGIFHFLSPYLMNKHTNEKSENKIKTIYSVKKFNL